MSSIAETSRPTAEPYQIAARLERLPYASWHRKMRIVLGTAFFFDGFDSLAIAYVLPVLIPLWHLAPGQTGNLIAIGAVGQLLGSIGFGWLAEKIGRVPVMMLSLLIFAAMSLACVWVWGYQSMLWLRFLQGLGLGGEIPIMVAYINEFAKAKDRARFSLAYQLLFPTGLVLVALVGVWVVPHLGWKWMFVIGAAPALLVIPMRRTLPESPRWLASRGRLVEADRSLASIERLVSGNGARPLPPIPADVPPVTQSHTRIMGLFEGIYLKRTLSLWALWFFTYIVNYGLTGWLPTIFRTEFKLPVSQALEYGLIVNSAGLVGCAICSWFADAVGRKPLFAVSLGFAAVPLFVLWGGGLRSPVFVLVLTSISFACLSTVAFGMGMYTAENYPNHMRALGCGVGSAWLRVGSIIGATLIGAILPTRGLGAVFGALGISLALGAVICALFSTETSGKVLEQLSPTA